MSRRSVVRSTLAVLVVLGVAAAGALFVTTSMPGDSHAGALPPLDAEQTKAADRIGKTVHRLAEEIGPRNVEHLPPLEKAAKAIERRWRRQGLKVEREEVPTGEQVVHNLIAELPGTTRAGEIVVVGAHYDTAGSTPGADDNASGVAALLELSRRFSKRSMPRTIRFVAFVNEEPPHFQTDRMGSVVNAKATRARGDNVVAMLSLETLGYYTDEPGTQAYPPVVSSLYPSEGNFVAFVSNLGSRDLVRRCVELFRDHAQFPSEGIAAPDFVTGIGWSDHWAFYREGYPAVMVTDTAPFRNPHYHEDTDRVEVVSPEHVARVVDGLEAVISELAGEPVG